MEEDVPEGHGRAASAWNLYPDPALTGRRNDWGPDMPIGIILGVLLTILGAYIHDSMVTGPASVSTPPAANQQLVNWNVASQKWTSLKASAKDTWAKLQNSTSKL
jgi:hypothetical protein